MSAVDSRAAAAPAGAAAGRPLPGRLVSGRCEPFYRDLVSCLQSTLGTVLRRAGHDPVEVLGSHLEFRYIPGDVRSEEFYLASRYPGDPFRSLAPRYPVRSAWRQPADLTDPLAELRAAVLADRLTIAAADNFHLPFRPAFGDVHAAHLVVVYGLDESRGLVYLSDEMPPAFCGAVPLEHFVRAWSSANPPDEQDAFFSDSGIDRRLLDVTLVEGFPRCDGGFLAEGLRADRQAFLAGDEGPGWSGLSGLRRFLELIVDAAAAGDGATVADVYPFGWAMQAQCSLRAELLRRYGTAHGVPELREAARRVETAAHAWTAVRVTAAHCRLAPQSAVDDLARHAAVLHRCYEAAVHELAAAEEAL